MDILPLGLCARIVLGRMALLVGPTPMEEDGAKAFTIVDENDGDVDHGELLVSRSTTLTSGTDRKVREGTAIV